MVVAFRRSASEKSRKLVDLAVVDWAERGAGRELTDCPAVAIIRVVAERGVPLEKAVTTLVAYNNESDRRGRPYWMILLAHADAVRGRQATTPHVTIFGRVRETYHSMCRTN